MRLHRSAIPAVVLFCAVAGFVSIGDRRDGSGFEERERTRLIAHFDSVLLELQSRDVSHLSADRLAARRRHIERLRQYRNAGVFPHNHATATLTPVFVDEHGTHCAMGYLIARDGRSDIVERIKSSRNLARIPELAGDTALVAWLDANGLAVDEAARIQPAYDGDGLGWVAVPEKDRYVRPEFAASSLGYASVATVVSLANLINPGRPGLYRSGALLSFAGFALALSADADNRATTVLTRVDAGVAVASLLLAAHSARRDPARVPKRQASLPATTTFTASPLVTPRSTGVVARMTF